MDLEKELLKSRQDEQEARRLAEEAFKRAEEARHRTNPGYGMQPPLLNLTRDWLSADGVAHPILADRESNPRTGAGCPG